MVNLNDIQFLKSAARLSDCPPDTGREVAFCGRSNAGKSSAINEITGHRKLARTSKTPGRTQLINFFSLDDDHRLVDLPGYGYAKVPTSVKTHWHKHLDDYLRERRALVALVLLMDIRHPLKPFDQMMIEWSATSGVELHILLTKADKLKKGAAQSTLLTVRRSLGNNAGIQTFSATKHTGVDLARETIQQFLTA